MYAAGPYLRPVAIRHFHSVAHENGPRWIIDNGPVIPVNPVPQRIIARREVKRVPGEWNGLPAQHKLTGNGGPHPEGSFEPAFRILMQEWSLSATPAVLGGQEF